MSKPIQTTVTRSGVKPANQASLKSWLVPVLPAMGRSMPCTTVTPGAVQDNTLHHFLDLIGAGGVGKLWAGVCKDGGLSFVAGAEGEAGWAPDGVAVAVLHAIDEAGDDDAAALVDGGVRAGFAQHGGFDGAERGREDFRHAVVQVVADGGFGDGLHADALGDADGDEVQGFGEGFVERGRAAEIHFVVIRMPVAQREKRRRESGR